MPESSSGLASTVSPAVAHGDNVVELMVGNENLFKFWIDEHQTWQLAPERYQRAREQWIP